METRHATLLHLLKDYAQPNKKIHELLRSKDLLPLTRGFYLLSPEKLKQPYQPELIANLMYGPSYVSLETALSYHGLIPERPTTVTSVTTRRPKVINTPVGIFTYDHLIQNKYVLGVQQARTGTDAQPEQETRFLIASPAKALMDYVTFRVAPSALKTSANVARFLQEDLRFDLARYREQTTLISVDEMRRAYARSPRHSRTLLWLRQELL